MWPYFIFNGISSEKFGIIVNKLPSIFRPAKDIKKIEIEGRDGFLLQDNNAYESIIKTVECTIRNTEQIDEICEWLNGSGDVIFSSEDTKKYKATIINEIEFSKILREFKSFIIQFECQPYGHDLNNSVITLTKNDVIYNSTNTISKPTIKIFGTGSVDLTINSSTIHLTNIVDYVEINSELMDCYKDTVLKNNDMNGDFPIFTKGKNVISWTGTVVAIEIIPNWRWI